MLAIVMYRPRGYNGATADQYIAHPAYTEPSVYPIWCGAHDQLIDILCAYVYTYTSGVIQAWTLAKTQLLTMATRWSLG